MIVGLKYVGAADGFPTRITVGDSVSLQREQSLPLDSGAVAAYYEDRKVGYLSSEKQALWDSLGPSARYQAKVIGEILDEDGDLAGLDIELNVPGGHHEPLPAMEPEMAERAPWSGKTLRAIVGFGVLFLTVLADADSTDPASRISAVTNVTHKLPLIDQSLMTNRADNIKFQDRRMVLAQVVKLTPSDQVKHLSMPNDQGPIESKEITDSSVEQMQAQELNRIVQQATAHRLAQDLKRRAEAEILLQQTQVQRIQQLGQDLRQARETVARQQIRLDQLEQQASETAAHWQAENRKLQSNIALLRQPIEEMLLARAQLEKEVRKQLAFRELNQEELVRHKNRMVAWTLAYRAAQAKEATKSKIAPRQKLNEQARVVSMPTDKSKKKRRKANFSRYAQENRDLDLNPTGAWIP